MISRFELIQYITDLGGFAWPGKREEPDVHSVVGGWYYGFYIRPTRNTVFKEARAWLQAARDAGGYCHVVATRRDVERILERDDERGRWVMGRGDAIELLRKWGRDDPRLDWLQWGISGLDWRQKRLLEARYCDRLRMDQLCSVLGMSQRQAYRTWNQAIDELGRWVTSEEGKRRKGSE